MKNSIDEQIAILESLKTNKGIYESKFEKLIDDTSEQIYFKSKSNSSYQNKHTKIIKIYGHRILFQMKCFGK